MKKNIIFILSFLFLTINLKAQVSLEWVARYGIDGSNVNAMVLDDSDNVYITGRHNSPTKFATMKYNKMGAIQWFAIFNDSISGNCEAKSIAVDKNGNVYVTGRGQILPSTGDDYLTIKYNSFGIVQWVKRYDGIVGNQDNAVSVKVDNYENVYVSGCSKGIGLKYDYLTIKYNSIGEEQWTQRYNGTGDWEDIVTAMVLDDSGNVIVTGYSSGSGIVNVYDYLTIKYNPSGEVQWIARYNSKVDYLARARSIAADKHGNIFVTGDCNYDTTYQDYVTVKYNSSGVLQWASAYDADLVNDYANSIAVDIFGNVCVTGISTTSGHTQFSTVMYDSNGIELWVNVYSGAAGNDIYDEAYAVAFDSSGNSYITGSGSSILKLRYEYVTIKYNNIGIQQWIQKYSIPNTDEIPVAIAVGKNGNIFVSGSGRGFLTLKYSQSVGIQNISTEIPDGFSLHQNYPNPFNPTTNIGFSLPKNSFVTLKIFDVTGKEISELLNENLLAGTFRYEFNGENLPTGVYYYRLEAGTFSQTKKMLLIK